MPKQHGTALTGLDGRSLELAAAVVRQLPRELDPEFAQFLIENQAELAQYLREALVRPQPDTSGDIAEWQDFYQKLGVEVDISSVRIPAYKPDFDRVIVVASGLKLEQVFQACKERFPAWKYADDLDRSVVYNDRSPANGSYAIRVRNRVEADEELKNLSAEDLARKKIAGITLLERLILELKYFEETGQHLDIENFTLCSGSRNSGGYVPRVDWGGGRLGVSGCSPRVADPSLRARAVVS